MASTFLLRHILFGLSLVVSIFVGGFTFGFLWWSGRTETGGIAATYYTDGLPFGFEVAFMVASTLSWILLGVMLIVERVKRHSMLSVPWEMVYIGLIFVLWISVAIYGRIDPSPFTEPYSSVASDSCLNAKGQVKTWCGIYQATTVLAFLEAAILLAWLALVFKSAPLDPFWAWASIPKEKKSKKSKGAKNIEEA